ncbi:MAG: hypothetical protein K2W97_05420 [Chthoniobacterales bacterium]|nr:hypothetical protein [Chthoniobacterales bacterium]
MNPSTLQQLSSSLRERLSIIADHELRDRDPATHLKKLQEASEAIEQWEKVLLLEKNVDPKLRHYLAQRSYDKALEWLASMLI